jgi:hypothetical protein
MCILFISGNDSFGGEYNFRVYTLYDYIPPEESDPDPDNPSYTRFFEYKHRGDICNLIQRLSIIRLYLVGNEPDITNKWSKRLIASELDVNHAQASQYEDRCTFIENQLVVTPIQDLAQRCGRTWQMSSIKPRKIRDLRDDLVFGETVQRIHGCLENREMAANVELRQRISESTEDITTFSSRVCINRIENFVFEILRSIIRFIRSNKQKMVLKKKKRLQNFSIKYFLSKNGIMCFITYFSFSLFIKQTLSG